MGVAFSYECGAATADNSACLVRVYQVAVTAAEWYNNISLYKEEVFNNLVGDDVFILFQSASLTSLVGCTEP